MAAPIVFSMACLRCRFIHRFHLQLDVKNPQCIYTWSVLAQRMREGKEKVVSKRELNENNDNDFFGVSSTVAELEKSKDWKSLSADEINKKYIYGTRKNTKHAEQIVQAPYGDIRYDRVNSPRYAGGWDKIAEQTSKPAKRRRGIRKVKPTTHNVKSNERLSEEGRKLLNKLSNIDSLTQREYFGAIYKLKALGLHDQINQDMLIDIQNQRLRNIRLSDNLKTNVNKELTNFVQSSLENQTMSKTIPESQNQNATCLFDGNVPPSSNEYFGSPNGQNQQNLDRQTNENLVSTEVELSNYVKSSSSSIHTGSSTISKNCQKGNIGTQSSTEAGSVNFIDEQYFHEIESESSSVVQNGEDMNETLSKEVNQTNLIEEQYFGSSDNFNNTARPSVEHQKMLTLSEIYSPSLQQEVENEKMTVGYQKNVSINDQRPELNSDMNKDIGRVKLGNAGTVPEESHSTNFVDDQYFNPSATNMASHRSRNDLQQIKVVEDQYFRQNYSKSTEELCDKQLSNSEATSSSLHVSPPFDKEWKNFDSDQDGMVKEGKKFTETISEQVNIAKHHIPEEDLSVDLEGFVEQTTINTKDGSESLPAADTYDFRYPEKPEAKESKQTAEPRWKYESVIQNRKSGPKTAYEFIKMSEAQRTNPRLIGVKAYTSLIPDLDHMSKEEMVALLTRNVIYNKGDIVAINKPYGLPSKPGPKVRASVAHLLQALAQKIDRNLDNLYLVHRLDKETTGIMLLAKSMKTHQKLQGAFLRQEVIKKYITVTRGIPSPTEGVIEIPIGEVEVGSKVRMGLLPNFKPDGTPITRSTEGRQALTRFKVLHHNNNAALVECHPQTGVKHQIRVHLALGLNTPILGDHKYSHIDKIAPMKLQGNFLDMLKIPQSKVRHIPMHLHASSLMIPHFLDGQNLYISCSLPKHITHAIKRLKIMSKR